MALTHYCGALGGFSREGGKHACTDWVSSRGQIMVTEIAQRLGYANLTSFVRAFKAISGVTPTQYAKGVIGTWRGGMPRPPCPNKRPRSSSPPITPIWCTFSNHVRVWSMCRVVHGQNETPAESPAQTGCAGHRVPRPDSVRMRWFMRPLPCATRQMRSANVSRSIRALQVLTRRQAACLGNSFFSEGELP